MLGVAMTFGELLRQLREKAGLSQPQLAERAGIPVGSLRSHEQGRRSPSWAAVVRLAKALGVPTDTFAECDEVRVEREKEPDPPKRRGKK